MTAPSEVAADIVVIVLIIGCCGAPSLRYESALIEVAALIALTEVICEAAVSARSMLLPARPQLPVGAGARAGGCAVGAAAGGCGTDGAPAGAAGASE